MATIDCPHKQHLLYKTDTLIRFPIKRWERKFKNHGLLLKERCALPPEGFTKRYHCEKGHPVST